MLTFPCQTCQTPIRFAEEDRGGSVYCPSCGRENTVPEAEAPSLAPAPVATAGPSATQTKAAGRVRAFGEGNDISDLVVGKVACLCGHVNSVRYRDVDAGFLFCASCSTSVPLGETLEQTRETPPPASDTTQEASPPRPRPRRKSALGYVTALAVATVFVMAVYLTWKTQGDYIVSLAGLGGPPLIAPEPRNVKPLAKPSAPAEALTEEEKSQPEKSITLEAIESLLRKSDLHAALVDAQLWEQLLADVGVPETDPRRVRLKQIIAELEKKLSPKPAPSPQRAAAFRKELDRLRAAIEADKLAEARQSRDRAEKMFAEHPDELAPFGPSFAALKAKLRQLELTAEGLQTVQKLLARAHEIAAKEDGDVTESLECEAQAKFLALRTDVKNEGPNLERSVKELSQKLLFARGRRAVADAEQCLKEGDSKTRDQLLLEARGNLEGLPIDRIRSLVVRADQAAKSPTAGSADSPFSLRMQFRKLYEDALQPYSTSDARKAMVACLAANKFLSAMKDQPKGAGEKLARMLFDVLDREVEDVIALPESDAGAQERLVGIRSLLDEAVPWRNDPRWRQLDASVRLRGDRLAQQALRRAEDLAKKDLLAEAIAAAGPAEKLGKEETARTAHERIRAWQAEIDLRKSLAAQDEHWKKIEQLRSEGRIFETWREVKLFLQRYPNSPRKQQAQTLDADLAAQVDARVDGALREIEANQRGQKWPAFRKGVELLAGLPLPEKHARRVEEFRRALTKLNEQAEGKFQAAKAEGYPPLNVDRIVKLLEQLPKVLELNPDHKEAAAMYEESKARGQERAAKLWERINTYKRPGYEDLLQEKLEEIIRLDPDGPTGQEARKLLKGKR